MSLSEVAWPSLPAPPSAPPPRPLTALGWLQSYSGSEVGSPGPLSSRTSATPTAVQQPDAEKTVEPVDAHTVVAEQDEPLHDCATMLIAGDAMWRDSCQRQTRGWRRYCTACSAKIRLRFGGPAPAESAPTTRMEAPPPARQVSANGQVTVHVVASAPHLDEQLPLLPHAAIEAVRSSMLPEMPPLPPVSPAHTVPSSLAFLSLSGFSAPQAQSPSYSYRPPPPPARPPLTPQLEHMNVWRGGQNAGAATLLSPSGVDFAWRPKADAVVREGKNLGARPRQHKGWAQSRKPASALSLHTSHASHADDEGDAPRQLEKKCNECGNNFTALHPRSRWCPECCEFVRRDCFRCQGKHTVKQGCPRRR